MRLAFTLRLKLTSLVTCFLLALTAGAILVLVRNGAISLFEHGWPHYTGGLIGTLNRNYAALACGLSVLATVSLLHLYLSLKGVRSAWSVMAVLALIVTLLFAGTLLAGLMSRTADSAAAPGLAGWFICILRSAEVAQTSSYQRLEKIALIIVAASVIAVALHYVSSIVATFSRDVPTFRCFLSD
jgi:hypothetical protein